jgi:molecular chaperone GrpE
MSKKAKNTEFDEQELDENEQIMEDISEDVLQMAANAVSEGSKIEELESQIHALKDAVLRGAADLENSRKRAEKELQDVGKYAISAFAKDMVNVMENLERTIAAIPDEQKDSPLFKGVQLTHKELAIALERRDIKQINPQKGEKFDHNIHQAMSQIAEPGVDAGCIVQTMQTGYIIHERLLRPAMVIVSKNSEEAKHEVDTSA